MSQKIQHYHIFLASPGDVAAERAVALEIIDKLNHDPGLMPRIRLDPIAWDSLGTRTPMLATKTPQEAIKDNLPKPSDCDIVIVIFWARMGTPLNQETHGLKPDGSLYLSGTEWEYLDALHGAMKNGTGKPHVIVYRRTEKVLLDPDDTDFEDKRKQYDLIKKFFSNFNDNLGTAKRGYNQHASPSEFATLFEENIRFIVNEEISSSQYCEPSNQNFNKRPNVPWNGSPFPGLRTFTPDDAPIFFGRRHEIDALTKLIIKENFVAVVGSSGSGKSSLVGAGLIPRLESLEESRTWLLPKWHNDYHQWLGLRFTPGETGENPVYALASRLAALLSEKTYDVASTLRGNPASIDELFRRILEVHTDYDKSLLFIDQFEELFTAIPKENCSRFLDLLALIVRGTHVRIVITMRADFFHQCVDYPVMAALLEHGTYPLSIPRRDMLREMIELPGARAGLTFERGLVEEMLDDMGDEPGNLALMAYLLDELYRKCGLNTELSIKAYHELNGIKGAIGKRAETAFRSLNIKDSDRVFQHVFRHLVEIDDRGIATRQRARLAFMSKKDNDANALIEAFTDARLLTTTREGTEPIVEVAHEALLQSWDKLSVWILERHDDLRLYKRIQIAAQEWEQNGKRDDYLWSQERLENVYQMQERLDVEFSSLLKEFTHPEIDRLIAEFKNEKTPDYRQNSIADRIAEMGENGLPAMLELFDTASQNAKLRSGWFSNDLYHTVNKVTDHMHAYLKLHESITVPVLIDRLQASNINQRWATVLALGSMEASVLDYQLSTMNMDSIYYVEKKVPLGNKLIVPALCSLLGDPDSIVRQNTVYALGLISDASVVSYIRPLLNDADSRVRANTAVVLGFYCDDEAIPSLLERANIDNESSVRRASAMALGKIGHPGAVNPLLGFLRETDEDFKRERILSVLRQYDDERVQDILRQLPAENALSYSQSFLSENVAKHHWSQKNIFKLKQLLNEEIVVLFVIWSYIVFAGIYHGILLSTSKIPLSIAKSVTMSVTYCLCAFIAGFAGATFYRYRRKLINTTAFELFFLSRLYYKLKLNTVKINPLITAYFGIIGVVGLFNAHFNMAPAANRLIVLCSLLLSIGLLLGWRFSFPYSFKRLVRGS